MELKVEHAEQLEYDDRWDLARPGDTGKSDI